MSPGGGFLVTTLVALCGLAVACSVEGNAPPEPATAAASAGPALVLPAATLQAPNGARVEAGRGTYCWSGSNYRECKEFVAPVTNVDPLVVARGEVLTLEFAQGMPDELSCGWARVVGAVPPPVSGARVWNSDQPRSLVAPSGLQTEAPRDAGGYVIGVFAKWDGVGDIMYGFYVEVR